MTDFSQVSDLMLELLEQNTNMEEMTFTDRGREIIDEISDYAEQTEMFKVHKEQGEMFSDSTVKQIFGYMLDRIVKAPTKFFRDASVILIMPFVRQKLREEKQI